MPRRLAAETANAFGCGYHQVAYSPTSIRMIDVLVVNRIRMVFGALELRHDYAHGDTQQEHDANAVNKR
jgi:hypothetical protein